jgi:hypothetical protein
MSEPNKRHALRLALNAATQIQPIGQPEIDIPEPLARVYERVPAATEFIGSHLPGVVRDLSTNGAFVAGEPLPLLSRVAFSFEFEAFGAIEAIGWVLWRRTEDCGLVRPDGKTTLLPSGFGVLFEAIPLDARLAIHRRVTSGMS